MYHAIDRFIGTLAKVTAILGGFALVAVTVMTCVSIIGRTMIDFGLGPIPGDFELVEMGIGFAVFAALPWAQYARAHATVDLFAPLFGARGNRVLDLVADLAMTIAAWIIAWRLYAGMADKMQYAETTFILQFPVWVAYALGMIGAVVFVLASAFSVWRSARALLGREIAA